MAGDSCCDPRLGPLPAWLCVPLASRCRPVCSRSPATDCQSKTCSATPPSTRGLSRPFNFLREGTVEDRFDAVRPRIWTDRSVESYYRQNILLYCHKDYVRHYPALSQTVA